jgi:hypothetical protein
LAEGDKYKEERKADPTYEEQIARLRDFVRRYDAGERMDWPPQPVP